MTTPIDDGGPAFPCDHSDSPHNDLYQGMKLLQWYAGMALNVEELSMLHSAYSAAHPDAESFTLHQLRVWNADQILAELKKENWIAVNYTRSCLVNC